MRIPPQVTERVKEAPAQALRAVFSGIGQVLLVADRIKNRAAEPPRAEPGVTPRTSPGPGPGAPAKSETRWRSLDETGNVRLLSEEDAPAPVAEAAEEPVPAEDVATTEEVEEAEDIATTEEVEVAEDAPAPASDPAALPVPNYDELTVASLRARLRNLDSSQVRTLLDYEKANAGRPAVLTMFERRIAKLDSGEA